MLAAAPLFILFAIDKATLILAIGLSNFGIGDILQQETVGDYYKISIIPHNLLFHPHVNTVRWKKRHLLFINASVIYDRTYLTEIEHVKCRDNCLFKYLSLFRREQVDDSLMLNMVLETMSHLHNRISTPTLSMRRYYA